jgi:integrase
MHARKSRVPSYRLHKPTNQAVVTINGRDVYLGKHNTSESRAEYDRVIAEWLAKGRTIPHSVSGTGSDISVNELMLAYLEYADGDYVKNGKPVADSVVDAIQPSVSRQVWTMIQLQRYSGMRPGEVCSMRTIDVNTACLPWIYTPESHKTEHHGRERTIPLGPVAREILQPWLRSDLAAYLFSPVEAEEERRTVQRRKRQTPVQPSQRNRRRRKPKTAPGVKYTKDSYRRAIERGIAKANQEIKKTGGVEIPHWHPNQLRHDAATRLRREFGLDVARAVLGHSSPIVTEVYAELDQAKAAEAMEKVG